jgi:hypothetical protein
VTLALGFTSVVTGSEAQAPNAATAPPAAASRMIRLTELMMNLAQTTTDD